MAWSLGKALQVHRELLNERIEWEQEWRRISEFLLPGRGIYQVTNRPTKRQLVSPKVVNGMATDALAVLVSGLHTRLTSPSTPWFSLAWSNPRIAAIEPLTAWLQQATHAVHSALQDSNFYSVISPFYMELAGFGTACMYIGEDTYDIEQAFRFELLTAGEYSFSMGVDGLPDVFCRTIFMTPAQVVDKFGGRADKAWRQMVNEDGQEAHTVQVTLLEIVYKESFLDKAWTRLIFDTTQHRGGTMTPQSYTDVDESPLQRDGFYEFPYPLARWEVIGSDTYGLGPGSRTLPDIRRLQEVEKAFLMAVHKAIDPPVSAPARMRGKLTTLPGGINYYATPQEQVVPLYNVPVDFNSTGAAFERIESRIKTAFYNDLFLTAVRDPNASPLRTGQVMAMKQEELARMGPIVERMQYEFLSPLINRCFQILLRRGYFEPMDPQLAAMAAAAGGGTIAISLISPMATAQRAASLDGVNAFLAFTAQAAQFDQSVLDNIDVDSAVRLYGNLSGVDLGILRPQEQVMQIREARAQEQRRQQALAEQAAIAQAQGQVSRDQAGANLAQAQAAQVMAETQGML